MESEEFSIYFYNPSLAASAVFTILYFLTSLFHLYMTVIFPRPGRHHRARHFIPLLIGAFLEVAGYAIRCGSIQDTSSIPLYAVSATLIVIGPVFVCASLYMLMDRLIWPETEGEMSEKPESFLFIRVQRRWLPRIFVTLDVISCLVQASGSGIAASGNWEGSEKDTGTGVLIGGLVLQVVTFVAFLLTVGSFNFKNRDQDIPDGAKQLIVGIYISGFFILVRSIYRVVEFALGVDSYIFSHEWPLYVLEAVPMLIAISLLGWYHPGRFLA